MRSAEEGPLVADVAAHFGRLVPIIGGQIGMAAGLLALAAAPAHTPVVVVGLLMVPVGVGGSFTVPPIASLLLDSVATHQAGTASGVLNTFRQMGGSSAWRVTALSSPPRPACSTACGPACRPPPAAGRDRRNHPHPSPSSPRPRTRTT